MKFSYKVVIASSFLLIVSISLLSISQYLTIKSAVEQQIAQTTRDTINGVSRTVSYVLDARKAQAQYVTSLANNDLSRAGITDVIENPTLHQNFLLVGGGMETDGKAISGDPNWDPGSEWDARTRPWYQDAKERNQLIITAPYADAVTGDILISIATPLQATGEFKGALFFDMSLKTLSEMVNDVALDSGYLFIVTDQQVVLAHPDAALNGQKMAQFLPNVDLTTNKVLHTQLNSGEERIVEFTKIAGQNWYVGAVIDQQAAYSTVTEIRNNAIIYSVIALLISMLLLGLLMKKLMTPLRLLNQRMEGVASGSGDLTQRLNTDIDAEFAQLSQNFNVFTQALQQQIKDLKLLADKILDGTESTKQGASTSAKAMGLQLEQIEQLATAMHEMSVTSNDVANNAQGAAAAAQEAEKSAQTGSELVAKTTQNIHVLSQTIERSTSEVEKLKSATTDIDTVLKVISDIAEQTNLLALNAAIEAARAGEYGRGFAVVADEVRSLASRTQDSTTEIHTIIAQLHTSADSVVSAMRQSKGASEETVENAGHVEDALQQIYHAIQKISDMNIQIASAAEEQSLVAEEINTNTVNIKQITQEVTDNATQANKATEQQVDFVKAQHQVLGKFTV
ncbi:MULTISPECIES: methyl-accepting chemotaxis protein [unclassified Vibrio]|uniref:Methyl-accepting chemotaxis protein n=1 Tax=Vibrio sp. HB236076 TaxID=3232307 RepID=A0AB39HE83_9VIBR|nr:methyl-accepting chemotaxis protein [Vibrio sp. HB161653]MDP5254103.1 methyl-accepting chemotaxis protein [Vibrio sp. HB161653]